MKRLEELRKDRGVTKAAVQRMLGVSRPTYDRYELYPGEMRAKDLDLVCDFLHIEKSDIFLATEES
ncbi:MAG: helix-turn-helix transcriptional regulator [Coriobacteriaceae bacterium]|nr:helix-turn-helix transcriptional regulator [Coriobacteriaceae bacterium]